MFWREQHPDLHLYMDASDEGLAVLDPAHKRYLQIRFDDEERHDITSAPDPNGFTTTSENSSALPWRLLYGIPLPQDVPYLYKTFSLIYRPTHWPNQVTTSILPHRSNGVDGAPAPPTPLSSLRSRYPVGIEQVDRRVIRPPPFCPNLATSTGIIGVSSAILSVSMQDTDSLCKGCHGCRQHHEGNAQFQPFFSVDSAPTAISSPKTTAYFGGAAVVGFFFLLRRLAIKHFGRWSSDCYERYARMDVTTIGTMVRRCCMAPVIISPVANRDYVMGFLRSTPGLEAVTT
ncbi:hypothetical protein F444_22606 [Phytophthora nicotianae P1976]|uniref:Uncharacterized protein n=1 Tax=Phytophthora nicotianae P1976 TaxID=1317066 RepID=A0A080YXA6_PHYNI|nr:hypothetical protein F444_22606 [Phytophthora nicotianae P1976]